MSRKFSGVSRRTALKTTGGSIAAVTLSGLASAEEGDLVRINVGYSAADGRKAALDAASDVVREFDFDALTVRVPKGAAEALSNRSDVRYVEEDGTWRAFGCRSCGNDPTRADYSCGEGSGADIAIIDTGIQSTHNDLDSYLGAGHDCVSCWGSDCYCYYYWDDDHGHGTHCAGIAGGEDGVARNATLHAVKVLDSNGSGSWSDIACGIEWAAKQGYEVESLSLGGSTGSSTVRQACEYAWNNGVLLVAAAGNGYGDPVSYPAAYEECMAVTAVDCYDNWASYSNEGPEVEITAPGSDINSEYPCSSCNTLSGTSMATPHVAGAGAILMANGWSNSGARQRLRDTADDIGLPSYRQGDGRLNVERATC